MWAVVHFFYYQGIFTVCCISLSVLDVIVCPHFVLYVKVQLERGVLFTVSNRVWPTLKIWVMQWDLGGKIF
jgi:hypothetical protein